MKYVCHSSIVPNMQMSGQNDLDKTTETSAKMINHTTRLASLVILGRILPAIVLYFYFIL